VKKTVIEKADRLYQLPPDIFSFVRTDRKQPLLRKTPLIDLGRFHWPIEPTSEGSTVSLSATADSLDRLREGLAEWFQAQHGVRINPQKELFIGAGISTLLYQLSLAFIDSGDIAFVPNAGLPLYRGITSACGGEPIGYPVSAKNGWRPDLDKINSRLGRAGRVLFLNSPHNPSGVELTSGELEEIVWLAGRENLIVINDAAYQSVSGRKIASLLSVTGGKKNGAEVYSFSYLLGLPPGPFGFVVGNREIISSLEQTTRLLPHRVSNEFAEMATAALRQFPGEGLMMVRKRLQQSLAAADQFLEKLSLERVGADAVPFLWARIERRRQSVTAATVLYRRSRVLLAPGQAFGDNGEGFLRLSLTAPADDFRKGCDRIKGKLRLMKLGEDE